MLERKYGENPMVENRAESHGMVDKAKRYGQILSILKESGKPLTATQIALKMFSKGYVITTDRNHASPRLTELMQVGKVEPAGKEKCIFSRRMVTAFRLRHDA
jgi:hypothetical protein